MPTRLDEFTLRPITPADDAAVAAVIRQVMPEFGASGPGFAINDPEVDAMFRAYQGPKAKYFVVDGHGKVHGGGGFNALKGGDGSICEVQKMYLLPSARGTGVGYKLLDTIINQARAAGFRHCYLETLGNMTAARALYAKFGFKPLSAPMGATGHHGCDAWYSRDL